MSGHGWDYLKHIQGSSGLGPRPSSLSLADVLVTLAPVRSLIGSVLPYMRKQPITRIRINRSRFVAAARARKALIERVLRTLSPAVRSAYAVRGLSLTGLSGAVEDIRHAMELERQAQADALVLAAAGGVVDLDELATQAAYKAWGETEARLGLPLSYGSFLRNGAYQAIRSNVDLVNVLPAAMGDWLARADSLGGLESLAGGFLSNGEFMVNRELGGTLDQVVGMAGELRSKLNRAGASVRELAGGFAESVEAGGLSIVQDAMDLAPDWLTSDLIGQVGTTLTRAIGAGTAGDLPKVFEAIGGGIMTIGVATGPAAPFVVAAGGLMMLGSMIADIFIGTSGSPPVRPARIASEHWGAFKLLYAASVDASAGMGIQEVSDEYMSKVFGDPNTGETMVRPRPGWSVPGILRSSRDWPHAMRMVDMFDRRALVENDRVAEWMRTGRGIMFDAVAGGEPCPNYLWAKVPDSDPFVKFAGAMASSPAPYATGGAPPGDGTWPVGPVNRWTDGYWSTPHYRAAYIAAVALGGCPPFASYGFWTDNPLATNYFASGGKMHCTGVGGRIDPGTGGRSFRWIPWASYYTAADGLWLVPPRRVPYHLQGKGRGDGAFADWLFHGFVDVSQINYAMDPELAGIEMVFGPGENTIAGSNAPEVTRLGMMGSPLTRAMTLEQFFAAQSGDVGWYGRSYDENESRTWFVKGTPAPLLHAAPATGMRRIVSRATMVPSSVQKRRAPEGTTAGVPTVAIVSGLGLAGLALWLALK